MEPDGTFVFCFPWAQKERALAAARSEGLAVIAARDVVPREGRTPLFSVFASVLGESRRAAAGSVEEPPFVVRHADGSHTDTMHAARARFGWPPST
jgi:tRNA1(Val) A37 N6-methylase TrmN6